MDYIKRIIDDWDPIDLLYHAPKDEYNHEIEVIRILAMQTNNVNELAVGIMGVFLMAFGDDTFDKSLSECECIAHKIVACSQLKMKGTLWSE